MQRYDLSATDASTVARTLWPLLAASVGTVVAAPLYFALLDVPLIRSTGWPMFLLAGIGAIAGQRYARADDRTWVRIAGVANVVALAAAAAWFFWLASIPAPDPKAASLSTAPDFRLPDQDGQPVALGAQYRGGHVLLVFYRGSWCPFCVSELRGLGTVSDALLRSGVRIVAVSVDEPAQARRAADRLDLKFPLLSDRERSVVRAYGVLHRGGGPDGEDVAIPAHFLIDSDGRIVWRRVSGSIQDRADPEDILRAARSHTPPGGV